MGEISKTRKKKQIIKYQRSSNKQFFILENNSTELVIDT